jgi:hypothetical protein
MKHAVRMLVLMLSLVGTYMAAAPRVPVLGSGPIPLCPPSRPNCTA